jgi:hypothetical protein
MRNQRLDDGVDNDACMSWLGDALEHAYARGRLVLLAYLEAVMEDEVFEVEWSSRGS